MNNDNCFYRFEMRVANEDKEGYYYTRWERAQKLTVVAKTISEAKEKAGIVLGDPPDGWRYVFEFVTIIGLLDKDVIPAV